MSTKTRFEKEAKDNSEMAYWLVAITQVKSERRLSQITDRR